MATLAFSHMALNCKDMAAIERFYTRYFGFKRARVIPLGNSKIVFLKCGTMYLELFDAEGDAPSPAPTADGHHFQGWRHLAFQVDNVDAKLAEIGSAAQVTLGPLDFKDFIPGWRTAWVSDPEGNIVEISQGYTDQTNPPPLE
jgi:glyoxylase I family protein